MNTHPDTMHKSKVGLPAPEFPRGILLREEARKSRRRLYPVSALYIAYALVIVTLAHRSGSDGIVLAWLLAGVTFWTLVEYLAHRYVLHGAFPDGANPIRRLLHRSFDHLHWEHHRRPWDGNHINGTIRDTLPVVSLLATASFLAPLPTLPVMLAGMLVGYVLEEWVHHSVHFYNFQGRYFRYIKKHHLYHHSPRGSEVAYGLSNGFWDVMTGTRIPPRERQNLYGRGWTQSQAEGVPPGHRP